MLPHAFYTVADRHFFVGAVALVNSLRLAGHREPIFLVDAGLTPEQRDLLSPEVTLLEPPAATPAIFLPPFGPMQRRADVAVVLDADVVVIRPLTELIELARGGRLVTFVNNTPNDARFFEEWSTTLGLGRLQQRAYFNAGQLLIPSSLGDSLLDAWVDGLKKVDLTRTWMGRSNLSEPFYFGDQDVLNALAMSRLGPDEVVRLEHRLAPHPPFHGLRLKDDRHLLCDYPDGVQPFFLHHTMAKPWLKATRHTVYSALLPRLLLATDVAVRVRPDQIPLRLRHGPLAAADRRRADFQALVHGEVRRQLGRFGIRSRIRAWRARRVAGRV